MICKTLEEFRPEKAIMQRKCNIEFGPIKDFHFLVCWELQAAVLRVRLPYPLLCDIKQDFNKTTARNTGVLSIYSTYGADFHKEFVLFIIIILYNYIYFFKSVSEFISGLYCYNQHHSYMHVKFHPHSLPHFFSLLTTQLRNETVTVCFLAFYSVWTVEVV